MSEPLPNRQTIRKRGWDYTTPGHYFVTINTSKNRPLFGTVVNGRMVLNAAGRVAERCWQEIPAHFPSARPGEFVVMPNHVHGVVELVHSSAVARTPALGDVIGAYKAAVSRVMGRGGQLPARPGPAGRQLPTRTPAGASAIWHRNYWDVIVREEKALAAISQYIRANPRNYDVVMNVGEPQSAGNKALLKLPKVGFLASRGNASPHGRLPVKSGEAILSGFLSPMERAVFKAGLEQKRPMIWVKPWGLEEGARDGVVRRAIEAGHLLVLSPFAAELEAPSVRRAAWCNQYVVAQCGRLIVGHLNPGGMLACVLSELDPEKEIVHL